eukprot:361354-Chlamydomonas_euryale.AAC.3
MHGYARRRRRRSDLLHTTCCWLAGMGTAAIVLTSSRATGEYLCLHGSCAQARARHVWRSSVGGA